MKSLPIIYDTDTKIHSVKITDAGMYTCQTENTTVKRIVLTIIRKIGDVFSLERSDRFIL